MTVYFFINAKYPKCCDGDDFQIEGEFAFEHCVAFEHDGFYFAYGLNKNAVVCGRSEECPRLSLGDWIEKKFGANDICSDDRSPGIHHCRIWRPGFESDARRARLTATQDAFTQSVITTQVLLDKMSELFLTIQPCKSNLKAFGLKTRENLLLACMEVESSLLAVLKENNYPPLLNSNQKEYRPTTNDYVKLCEPMLLDGYKISLKSYPDVPEFSPFAGWDPNNPTGSLSWYSAYNATKHNREDKLKTATLETVIHAVGAAVVMFVAQFGFVGGFTFRERMHDINQVFKIDTEGLNRHTDKFYLPAPEIVKQADGRRNPAWPYDNWTCQDYVFP